MLLPRDLLLRQSAEHAVGLTATEGRKETTLTGIHKLLLGAAVIASVLATAPGRSLPQPCLTTEQLQNEREGKDLFTASLPGSD